MRGADSRNFLRWFLLKENMNEDQHPLSAQTLESYPAALAPAQGARYEAEGEMELVRRACAGNQDAFAILVQNHQRRAFALAYRMLNNYDEATEAVQEAFLAAWQALHTFRGEARFSTWLYRIVYHCCLRVLEQRRRESRDLEAVTQQAQHQAVLASGEEVQSILTARERQQTIQQAIQELPGKYRAVLILRHLQELTYEEIAQALSLPVGTIKTHLFRARNLLKERLQLIEREDAASSGASGASISSTSTSPAPTGAEGTISGRLARFAPRFLHLGSLRESVREDTR